MRAARGSIARLAVGTLAILAVAAAVAWLVGSELGAGAPGPAGAVDPVATAEPADARGSGLAPGSHSPAATPSDDPAATRSDRRSPPGGRFVVPVSLGAPPAGTAVARAIHLLVEDPADPAGSRIDGPLAPEVGPDGRPSVVASARVLRWWVWDGASWHHGRVGDAAAARPEWGAHGLVRVLDARGRAVGGVDVTLQRSESSYRVETGRARTDADGTALLALPDERPSRLRPAPASGDTVLRVEIPAVPAVQVPFAAAGPWPVVVRLPPLASVDLEVVAADGTEPAGSVVLTAVAEGSQETGFVPSVSAPVERGRVRFPHVGPGLRLSATLRPGDDRVTTRVEFDAPRGARARSDGQWADATLPFGTLRPILTGRLLREEGGPAAQAWVQVTVPRESAASPWRSTTSAGATTDAEGRFRILPDVEARALDGAEVSVEWGPHEIGRRRCPRIEPGGTFDLGEFRAGAGPGGVTPAVLVAGRVADEAGAPAEDVAVQVWRRRGPSWSPVRGTVVPAGPGGAFEIRHDPGRGDEFEVRVLWDPRGRAADPVPFRPGATDAFLRLRRMGSVTVRVLLPAGLGAGEGPWVGIRDAASGAPPAPAANFGGDIHVFRGLSAGEAEIVAFPPGRPDDVIARKPVTIEAGAEVDAGTLDLRSVVPVIPVRVTDDAGKPVPDAAVWWRTCDADEHTHWVGLTCRTDGTATLPAMTPVDVLARRAGSGFAEARRVTAATTLRLPPPRTATTVEVRLADGIEVPGAPFRLAVQLGRLDESRPGLRNAPLSDPRNHGRPQPTLGARERRVTFDVTEPGRYVAGLMLWFEQAGSGHGRPLPLEGTVETSVDGDGVLRTLVVRFTPESLVATIQALREE